MNDSGPAIARDADSGPSKNFGTEPPHNVPQTNEGVPNRVDDNITGDHLAKRRREQGDQTVAADESQTAQPSVVRERPARGFLGRKDSDFEQFDDLLRRKISRRRLDRMEELTTRRALQQQQHRPNPPLDLFRHRDRTFEVCEERTNREQALYNFHGKPIYPPGKKDVDPMTTKDEILREYWELTCVPKEVCKTAISGQIVLREFKAGKHTELRNIDLYIRCACRAGLDAPVIRGIADHCSDEDIRRAAFSAAYGGHEDVIDLLADEYHVPVTMALMTAQLNLPIMT